ncbi:ERG7 [Sanghuangporus weigelae]
MWSPLDVPENGDAPFSDLTRWRLNADDNGRHVWEYLESDEACQARPQTVMDKFQLGLPTNLPVLPRPKTALDAARNGFSFLKHLQAPDGHWPCEYDGPMFLTPGLVIGSYVTGMELKRAERLELIRYLFRKAHKEDGGWGLHFEGRSTVFGTALNYTALRILGVGPDHPVMVKARNTLHKFGGAVRSPQWGKVWLSILNTYDWEGVNALPPELWLLPEWLPLHPHRWWIHARNVFIPMSFLYAHRFKAPEDDLILSLRRELYVEDYYSIDWPAQRNNICPVDIFAPHTFILDSLFAILGAYEPCAIPPLRKAGLARIYDLIVMEDENTAYQNLGPVNKMLNLVARTVAEGPESEAYAQHKLKRRDFMWIGPNGMSMGGTNGVQLWDLAFIVQALVETGLAQEEENRESLLKALQWLDESQIRENPKHYESAYRHRTKGAWPFSTKEQSYSVSDCTGEGMKAVIYLQEHVLSMPKLVSKERLCDAVDIIISMQNQSGGFASYELVRGPRWLEWINPAEVFGNIMIEYEYPECTTSAITALAIFRKHYPDYRSADIEDTIRKAVKYLHAAQRPEGGWFGSWGICFTYATQFALESLSLVGETYETSARVQKACHFLLSHQREDGGWGESYESCVKEVWVDHENTQVVMTCWAAMALMYAQYPEPEPIERAVKMVMSRQLPDGSWAQEAIEGMFNKTCAIVYPNFKFSFTVWMLGRAHRYLEKLHATRGKRAGNGNLANGNGYLH